MTGSALFTRVFTRMPIRLTAVKPEVEPEVAILGADQKERGLWGRECFNRSKESSKGSSKEWSLRACAVYASSDLNRPRSVYQYSSMAPRLSGQNCKIFKFLLSLNSQRRLRYKENNTKYRNLA